MQNVLHEGAVTQGIDVDVHELIGLRHQVGALEVGTKKRAFSGLAGSQASPFKGRGLNFEEVRRYQPGDEIRHMDWRVTARTGKPHLKLFQEERERPVFFLVDYTPSMFFGTRVAYKSVIAARTAALLAWMTLIHHDRIGALIFSDRGHRELRPTGGRSGVLQLTKALAEMHTHAKGLISQPRQSGSPMAEALIRVMRMARPGNLIFLISDFRTFDDQALAYMTQLSVHQKVILFMLFDPIEAHPPPPGQYRITDGTRFAVIDTFTDNVTTAYRNHFQQRREHIEACCRTRRMGFVPLSTDQPLIEGLRTGLRTVAIRMKR